MLGINQLMVSGGSNANYAFVHEGLIDERSPAIAPLADGNTTTVSIFERSSFVHARGAATLKLNAARQPERDVLWLHYTRKDAD